MFILTTLSHPRKRRQVDRKQLDKRITPTDDSTAYRAAGSTTVEIRQPTNV